jgi:ribosome-associated toxin RatA of RatAB toxin-antitoxin module
MRSVRLDVTVPGTDADTAYAVIADFSRYPELAPAVRSVAVSDLGDNSSVSRWEVNFRNGVLRWVEEDTFHPETRTIEFHQLEGDVDVFDGYWSCAPTEGGARVVFAADIDLGIPSLAAALEPIAARTLVENTVAIVQGLLGDGIVVESATTDATSPSNAVTASVSGGSDVPA